LARRIDEAEWFEMDDLAGLAPEINGKVTREEIDGLIAEAERLDDADPKLECLLSVIREKQSADGTRC